MLINKVLKLKCGFPSLLIITLRMRRIREPSFAGSIWNFNCLWLIVFVFSCMGAVGLMFHRLMRVIKRDARQERYGQLRIS